jgi:hypothetical protein
LNALEGGNRQHSQQQHHRPHDDQHDHAGAHAFPRRRHRMQWI